jgi:TonB family protein
MQWSSMSTMGRKPRPKRRYYAVAVQRQFAKIANCIGALMHRVFLGFLAVLVLFPAAPRAQDAPARACDLAAASPYDPTRSAAVPGVELVKIDPKIAVPACEAALATDPNNPRLLFQMGRASFAGKDQTRARSFYERSAAQGHAGAQNNLAVFYEGGSGGLPKDDQQAARLFKLAADSSEPNAQYSLGNFYEAGRAGLTKSDQEAVRLYKLSANQGNAIAQVKLGLLYATGRDGLPKDETEAARLLKLAASQGNSLGQFNLGLLYEAGQGGLLKNGEEAKRLYKLAADQGIPEAQSRLELYYATQRGGLQRSALEASRPCKTFAVAGGTAVPRWVTEYSNRIVEILGQHKRYPTTANLLGEQGTVFIVFAIDRQGRLACSHVSQSSGWALLDDEALSILHQSQPFPAFPDNSSEKGKLFAIPIRFDTR